VPVEEELATVRAILSLRCHDPRRWTFRAIAIRLEHDGRRTKLGGRWNAATIKKVWDRRELYLAHFDGRALST